MSATQSTDSINDSEPDDTFSRWWHKRHVWHAFALHLWRQLNRHNAFQAAASLCYTTLLALVPLLALILGVLSGLPIAENMAEQLQDFVFSNFVPATGETVQNYLQQFVGNTSTLTSTGGFFLIITALLLMNTIEHSMNRLWEVRVPRSLSSRLLMYWSVLTLGPVLFGGSLALTSYITTQALGQGQTANLVLRFVPFIVAWIGFAMLYLVAPNRHVRFRHAFAGGLLAAILFESAKLGFVWYVSAFPTYKVLYGALATFPIFLLWLYITWIITLLGATFTAALSTFHYRNSEWIWPDRWLLGLSLRLFSHLWTTQNKTISHMDSGIGDASHKGLSSEQLLNLEPGMSDRQCQLILGRCHRAGFITRDEQGGWMLACDLNEITLGDLYRSGSYILPILERDRMPQESTSDKKLNEILTTFSEHADMPLKRSIKSYIV